ncbi:hypothetical protein MCEREM21A_02100 [Sphingomonadaceae bacterium]
MVRSAKTLRVWNYNAQFSVASDHQNGAETRPQTIS